MNKSSTKPTAYIEIEDISPTTFFDKIASFVVENKEAGLIVALAIATSIILWAVAHLLVKLILVIKQLLIELIRASRE